LIKPLQIYNLQNFKFVNFNLFFFGKLKIVKYIFINYVNTKNYKFLCVQQLLNETVETLKYKKSICLAR